MTSLIKTEHEEATKTSSGIVLPDSEIGKQIGFVSDKFDGYLWYDVKKRKLTISLIRALHPGNHHCTKFIKRLKECFTLFRYIEVSSVSCILQHILMNANFCTEVDDEGEQCYRFWLDKPEQHR